MEPRPQANFPNFCSLWSVRFERDFWQDSIATLDQRNKLCTIICFKFISKPKRTAAKACTTLSLSRSTLISIGTHVPIASTESAHELIKAL